MLDRPYDHLWDMYYDEFEDENLENEPSLDEWTSHEYPIEYGIAMSYNVVYNKLRKE